MDNIIVRRVTYVDPALNGPVDPVGSYPFEPGLRPLSHSLRPQFPVEAWQSAYLEYLERRISRDHRDLLAHVQRILLYLSLEDAAAAFGSLLDLFIVLGPNGRALRQNLFRQLSGVLSEEQKRFFSSHMKTGVTSTEGTPVAPVSSLSKSLSGSIEIVIRIDNSEEQDQDPLDIAYRLMSDGAHDAALAILENALEDDPGRADLCMELLGRYKQRELSEAFLRTYSKMSGRHLAFPELWKKMESFFSKRMARQRYENPSSEALLQVNES